MTAKEILRGSKAREELLSGIEIAAEIVGSTLGPRGRVVAIEKSFGAPHITKDGVSVIKELELGSKFRNVGLQMLKEAANKSNDNAGDGTTSTVVLAHYMLKEGVKAVAAGMNPMDLRRGIEAATKEIVSVLKQTSKKVTSSQEIFQIATISANGDTDIGRKLSEAFEKVGNNGVVAVEDAKVSISGMQLDIVDGMSFDRGYISPYFITNNEKMLAELEKPYILICDKKISSIQPILTLLEAIMQSSRPLLIIAEDVEGEALAALIINKMRGILKVAAIKAPGFGDRRKAMLEDIAILTKAQLISEELGLKLENTTIEHLGSASRVVITKEDTTIIDGVGHKDQIDARCKQLDLQIKESTSEYDIEKLKERRAKLSNGIAVVRVGGMTEIEVKERKDRVNDAYHATKAAIEEGIVPGGGCALLYAASVLSNLKGRNIDEDAGINIVRRSLRAPALRILTNAGVDASIIVEKLIEKSAQHKNSHTGIFDAQKCEFVDAFDSGIIDPTKVVRSALESAASIAALLVITEAVVVEKVDDKKEACGHNPHAGGMNGGMGMDGMF